MHKPEIYLCEVWYNLMSWCFLLYIFQGSSPVRAGEVGPSQSGWAHVESIQDFGNQQDRHCLWIANRGGYGGGGCLIHLYLNFMCKYIQVLLQRGAAEVESARKLMEEMLRDASVRSNSLRFYIIQVFALFYIKLVIVSFYSVSSRLSCPWYLSCPP